MRYLLAALGLGLVAGGMLAASRFERRMADAARAMATLNLAGAARAYDELASYLDATPGLPSLLGGLRDELAARRAAVRYWQADYAGLLADHTESGISGGHSPQDLQFVVANAAYRLRPDAAAREEMLRSLDRAIGLYLRLIQASPGHRDAAFNYEFAIRMRKAVARGRPWPAGDRMAPLGREGEPAAEADVEQIKIYVPAEHDEESEMIEEPTVGEGQPLRRRG